LQLSELLDEVDALRLALPLAIATTIAYTRSVKAGIEVVVSCNFEPPGSWLASTIRWCQYGVYDGLVLRSFAHVCHCLLMSCEDWVVVSHRFENGARSVRHSVLILCTYLQ